MENFVREPGRTADPSAALGMTRGRAVTSIRSRQIGWIERNSRSLRYALLRFHGRPGQAG
jgi:hypothetical protein